MDPTPPAVRLHLGDCLAVMKGMETGSVDAVITDPPSGIGFMSLSFDGNRGGRTQWVAWLAERLDEARRVVRPGHYALVWALPRSSHWTGCAIEDAGWKIVDRISHIFGQGFPKSKACLKPAVEDWWMCRAPGGGKVRELEIDRCRVGLEAGIDLAAVQRQHSSTAGMNGIGESGFHADHSQPTYNPSGRYPPNLCLTHHPDCVPAGTRRVKGSGTDDPKYRTKRSESTCYGDMKTIQRSTTSYVAPDGTEEVAAYRCHEQCPVRLLDEMAGERTSGTISPHHKRNVPRLGHGGVYGQDEGTSPPREWPGDSGSASRFFPTFAVEAADFVPFGYFPKASKSDRGSYNTHSTVKSTALMAWLCRLITPPGGTILDPFLGSGSTALAAVRQGFGFVGVEENPEYLAIAERRLADERARTPLLA